MKMYRMYKMTPQLNTSHSKPYLAFSELAANISGATKPGVPHLKIILMVKINLG